METKLEKGSASIFIEKNNGTLKVYHGTDRVLLYSSEVYEGYWDNLWEAIKSNQEQSLGDDKYKENFD